ncbi:MAG: Gfo/Idh/MocA family oxidoreductase [Betaproteobacteria bacterium]
MTFSTLIVGLGQIGMGYDLSLDPDKYVLTHAKAFQKHPEFQLVGGVDPAQSRRGLFETHFSVPSYSNIECALNVVKPDVVVISTPTALHAEAIRSVLKTANPRAILCEKPLSYELDEAQEIVALCDSQKCQLFVNYMRRTEGGVAEVKRRLNEGSIGLPVRGVVWYSKGLFNNGSHFLNLLQYWLGEVTGFQVVNSGRLWGSIDPEPDLVLSFQHGKIFFLAAQEENYSHYTIELVAPNGRLRYEQSGERILWQGTIKDAACDGYTILDPVEEIIETNFMRLQWHVAEQLAAYLHGHQADICSGTEALQTLETLVAIRSTL